MRYNEKANLDPSRMRTGGGRGGGRGGLAIGGGVGGLVIVLIALFLGINPDMLTGGPAPDPQEPQQSNAYERCQGEGIDISKDRECRWVAYENSIHNYWVEQYEGHRPASMNIFTGQISTGCGTADSSVGPFYCPADMGIYLDTGFFDQLVSQLGAKGGDAAEAYVIAHEYGHHIQNLSGDMNRAQGDRSTGPQSAAVRLELQADCYAGVWLSNAAKDPESPIAEVTADDVQRAQDAAHSVGDDRIQERTAGRVDRESWTHGSAEQRQKWMRIGFDSGDPRKCNTWSGRL
ncbi:KPN_02809 family neutral zinc metallopeptidase [Enemella sp. A6]|uniref:KPN_02809 family neutral zinc metallopeptidase n=1 Tax=Enemella sp. A6 TaxID=3440152 RepID=UPI003EBC4B06